MTEPLTLDMGLTPKVFDDTIINASKPYAVNRTANGYHLSHNQNEINITLTEQPPRVIAGLSLPVTQVILEFIRLNPQQQQQFMERFMKYFHRGGG